LPHREPNIVVQPYAVSVSHSLNRNYSLPQQPLQLVYAGRLSERQKRISDLVHLVNALEQEGVNFQLCIIGDGSDKEILRRQIRALDQAARQRVRLEESLPPNQMPEVWRSADISILVSEYEGASIVMLEAMAQGCVPVVTRVSGTAAVIRPGVNGFLSPVGDVAEMARIIKGLDDDRSRLAELGEKAHATIVERFSYDEYLQ
jgi:glycosyltransferase involved in cell wall biosynthesis